MGTSPTLTLTLTVEEQPGQPAGPGASTQQGQPGGNTVCKLPVCPRRGSMGRPGHLPPIPPAIRHNVSAQGCVCSPMTLPFALGSPPPPLLSCQLFL